MIVNVNCNWLLFSWKKLFKTNGLHNIMLVEMLVMLQKSDQPFRFDWSKWA